MDDELSPAPDSDEEIFEDIDLDARDYIVRVNKTFAEDIQRATGELQHYKDDIDVITFESPAVITAQSRPVSDPLEDAASSSGQDQLDQIEGKDRAAIEKIADSGDKDKDFNAKKWLAGFFAIATLASGIVMELLDRHGHGKATDDLPVSPETADAFEKAYQTWVTGDDKTFWSDVADYVHKAASTKADVVYFMQYIAQICPLKSPFLWDRVQDKVDIVNGLITAYHDNGDDLAAMIRTLPERTYRAAPLPRAIAATCARLAVSSS